MVESSLSQMNISQNQSLSPKKTFMLKSLKNAASSYSAYDNLKKESNVNNSIENYEKTGNADSATIVTSAKTNSFLSNKQILNELRLDSSSRTLTAQQLAKNYSISVVRAKEILEELNSKGTSFLTSNTQTQTVKSSLSNPYTYSITDLQGDKNSTVMYSI